MIIGNKVTRHMIFSPPAAFIRRLGSPAPASSLPPSLPPDVRWFYQCVPAQSVPKPKVNPDPSGRTGGRAGGPRPHPVHPRANHPADD